MKKIKVLVTDQIGSNLITKADIFELDYNKKTRIKDLYKLIEKYDDYECYDKYIEPDYELYLRACYGYEHEKIDWNIKIEDLLVSKVKEYTNNDFIIIRAHGGVGCPLVDSLVEKIVELLATFLVNYILHFIMTYNKAVKIIERETGFSIDNIIEVIRYKSEWKYGFISNKDFSQKKSVEKKIMKKLGYKLKNNYWIM